GAGRGGAGGGGPLEAPRARRSRNDRARSARRRVPPLPPLRCTAPARLLREPLPTCRLRAEAGTRLAAGAVDPRNVGCVNGGALAGVGRTLASGRGRGGHPEWGPLRAPGLR